MGRTTEANRGMYITQTYSDEQNMLYTCHVLGERTGIGERRCEDDLCLRATSPLGGGRGCIQCRSGVVLPEGEHA